MQKSKLHIKYCIFCKNAIRGKDHWSRCVKYVESILTDELIEKIKNLYLIEEYGLEDIFKIIGIHSTILKDILISINIKIRKSWVVTKRANEKVKETCMARYGVKHHSQTKEFKEKMKETCMSRYGVDSPLKSIEIKEKMKETLFKNYGVTNPLKSLEIKEKMKKTNMERYGVEHITNSKSVREKINNTVMERYGVKNVFQLEEVKNKIKETCMEKYGVTNGGCSSIALEKIRQTCINKYGSLAPLISKPHKRILNILDILKFEYIIEYTISPYSVDILCLPQKIIEIYGDYWHANPLIYKEDKEITYPFGKILAKDKWISDYKRIKFLQNKGYDIKIFWEYDINNNIEIIKQELINFLEF